MGTHFNGTKTEKQALNLFIKLVRASNSVTSRINTYITENGLSVSQFGVLEALHHLGPLNQCDLSKKLLKTGGNITMVIDNLEKRDLVKRVRDTNDRRFIHVHLTPKGDELIKEIFPNHVQHIVDEMSVLTADEQEQFSQLCKKLGVGKPESEPA